MYYQKKCLKLFLFFNYILFLLVNFFILPTSMIFGAGNLNVSLNKDNFSSGDQLIDVYNQNQQESWNQASSKEIDSLSEELLKTDLPELQEFLRDWQNYTPSQKVDPATLKKIFHYKEGELFIVKALELNIKLRAENQLLKNQHLSEMTSLTTTNNCLKDKIASLEITNQQLTKQRETKEDEIKQAAKKAQQEEINHLQKYYDEQINLNKQQFKEAEDRLKDEKKLLETEKDYLQTEKTSLQDELKSSKTRYDEDLEVQKQLVTDLQNIIVSNKEEMKVLNDRYDKLHKLIQEINTSSEQSMKKIQSETDQFLIDIKDLQNIIKSKDQEIRVLNDQYKELQKLTQDVDKSSEQSIKKIQSKTDKFLIDIKDLQNTIISKDQEIRVLNDQYKELQTLAQNINKLSEPSTENIPSKTDKVSQDVKNLQNMITSKNQKMAVLNDKYKELQTLAQNINKLSEKSIKNILLETETILPDITNLQNMITSKNQKMAVLNDKYKELQTLAQDVTKLENPTQLLNMEKHYQKAITILEETIEHQKQENKRLTELNSALILNNQKIIDSEKKQAEYFEKNVTLLQKNLTIKENTITNLEAQQKQLREDHQKQLQALSAQYQKNIMRILKEKNQAKSDYFEFKIKYNDQKTALAFMKETGYDKKDLQEIQRYYVLYQKATREINDLKIKLKKAEQNNQETQELKQSQEEQKLRTDLFHLQEQSKDIIDNFRKILVSYQNQQNIIQIKDKLIQYFRDLAKRREGQITSLNKLIN